MDIRDEHRRPGGWSPSLNGEVKPKAPRLSDLPPEINMSELVDSHAKRRNQRAKVYEKVYRKCCQRIRYSNDTLLVKECLFQVPEVQLWGGTPRYQVNAVVGYIMIRLNQNGFATRYMPPRGIFISWKKGVSGDNSIEKVVRYELDEIETPKKVETQTTHDRLLHEGCNGACCVNGGTSQPAMKTNRKQLLEMERRKQQAEIEKLIERRDRH